MILNSKRIPSITKENNELLSYISRILVPECIENSYIYKGYVEAFHIDDFEGVTLLEKHVKEFSRKEEAISWCSLIGSDLMVKYC